MTVDELVDLTEALLAEAGFSLSALRSGTEALKDLTDEQFVLATRFLAGERPDLGRRVHTEAAALSIPRRERRVLSADEAAERLAALEELDEETPAGPVDIGDGVTLGL